eukprot:gene9844-2167_t
MSFLKIQTKKRSFGDYLDNLNPQCPSFTFSSSPTNSQLDQSADLMEEEPNPSKRVKTVTENIAYRSKTQYIPSSEEVLPLKNLENHIKNKKRKNEKLYTEDEVKSILEERESDLRDTYNELVQNLLQQQYNSFIKFNEDQISRQFKDREFSYTS